MTNNENNENNEQINGNEQQQYDNINVPDFSDMYKSEAQRLLKMINDQMQFYFNKNQCDNIDAFNIYQVLKKIEQFEANIPGIEVLKNNLINDIQQMVKHLEANFLEKRKYYANEITRLSDKIIETKKLRKTTFLKIIFFHWFLIPKFFELNREISTLCKNLKEKELEELKEKRECFNDQQLIYISHRFREKYLNIPLPENINKDLF